MIKNNSSQNSIESISVEAFDHLIDKLYLKKVSDRELINDVREDGHSTENTEKGIYSAVITDWVYQFCPAPLKDANEPLRIMRGLNRDRIGARGSVFSRFQKTIYIGVAALFVVVVTLGILPVLNRSGEFQTKNDGEIFSEKSSLNGSEIASGKIIQSGTYTIAPGRVMSIREGTVKVDRNENNNGTPDLTLSVVTLKADFNLAGGINFLIRHPFASIRVIGTAFSVEATERGGFLKVSKGLVEITHLNGSILKVAPGETVSFGENNLKKEVIPKKKAEKMQRLHFKNGKIISGIVLVEDSKTIKLKQKEGINIIIDKQDLS